MKAFCYRCRPCYYNTFQWAGNPPKLPLPLGMGPYLIHGSLGPPESIIEMASQLVQPFLYGSQLCPIHRQTDDPRRHIYACDVA